MSPHQTLVKGTREWLEHAQADLDACTALIAAGLSAEALFHAQQCAEKAMKAVLTWHQVSFRKTHDLDELKEVCLPLAGEAGAPYSPGRTEAEEAKQAASRLLDALAARLESQFGD